MRILIRTVSALYLPLSPALCQRRDSPRSPASNQDSTLIGDCGGGWEERGWGHELLNEWEGGMQKKKPNKKNPSYHLLYLSPVIYFSFIDTQLKCNHLCRSLSELPLAEHVSWVLAILHGLFTYLTLPYSRPPSGQKKKKNQRHQIYLCILSILKYLVLIFW